jgi:hypothetical protein
MAAEVKNLQIPKAFHFMKTNIIAQNGNIHFGKRSITAIHPIPRLQVPVFHSGIVQT